MTVKKHLHPLIQWIKKIILAISVFIVAGESMYVWIRGMGLSDHLADDIGYRFALAATILVVYVWHRIRANWLKH